MFEGRSVTLEEVTDDVVQVGDDEVFQLVLEKVVLLCERSSTEVRKAGFWFSKACGLTPYIPFDRFHGPYHPGVMA